MALLEFDGAAVSAAAELPLGKRSEPTLDLVKPGAAEVGVKCSGSEGCERASV